MKQDNNPDQDKKEDIKSDNTPGWIERTEAFIDEAADKIHQSDTYRKAGKSVESATKKIFRQAGKWWGKSQQHFKK
jgi:hypothetical protein